MDIFLFYDVVSTLLNFLDEVDQVGILNVEPDQLWSNFLCDKLVPLTSWTRYQIFSYLNYIEQRIKSAGTTQRTFPNKGTNLNSLKSAIQMTCANKSDATDFPPAAATIIHLTS